MPPTTASFRQFAARLRAGAHLAGTFVKTPTSHAIEILGQTGFDFVVIDMEHAAIGLAALDQMLLAARGADIAGVVRVAEAAPSAIQTALDTGASGVLVPHICSRERAEAIVAAARYKGGRRGFANTTRAGAYGAVGYEAHKATQDHETACIAMIEDLEALDVLDDILSVAGLDAIFIGRGDLTAALGGEAINDPRTMEAVRSIMAAAIRHGVSAITICSDGEDARAMAALGATAFMMGSDQGFMAKSARAALTTLAELEGRDKDAH
ncbi:HpcH/HpaI aldolase/citrate lyase family protein [Devosia ginsengisoli]|uniref:HpcH/HpaI aldolase family protein n=1 Tax=Devosia ginsengisoli TaxID=400770 RepID=UPI0026EAEDDC|nr:aldolase/citrate lyase family protein [Devosia ginsengisoli]MCR6673454.1 aldolase/citrate lyase family protein [Devosia ginsengisoli]